DADRESAVGAGTHREMDVGLLGGAGAVRVDHDDLGATLLRLHGVGHDVDLGIHRVAAPDHHQVRMLVDLAHVGAALHAGAGDPASVGERHADGREPARVLHRVAQAVDAVALHQPHRPGVVVRPDRLAAVLPRLGDELLGDDVERVLPGDLGELLAALRSDPAQRLHQPVGMMDALGVARDLLADHARGVVVALRAAHPADPRRAEALDLQRAGAGAVVRADRGHGLDAVFGAAPDPYGRIGMIVGGHMVDAPRELPQHIAQQSMGTPRIRRASEDDSGALATLVPGLVPQAADAHHATFVIDGPYGPMAVLDLLQAERHLELLHLRAPDLAHAQVLQDFAEQAARALRAREIRLGPNAMDDAQAATLGYRGRAKRVRPEGVPVWRDGTAPFGQSLYYRGVWAALALLTGLGSVSMAVFNSSRVTMVHIAFPALLCSAGALFASWQILLIVQAAQRTRRWLFALSAAVGLATVGLIGLTIHDRAVPALAELWAIRAGDTAIGDLEVDVSDDGQIL